MTVFSHTLFIIIIFDFPLANNNLYSSSYLNVKY